MAPPVWVKKVGQLVEIPITLTMPEGGNFTNIQFEITFPDGLRPVKVSYNDDDEPFIDESDNGEEYGCIGEDIPLRGGFSLLGLTDNLDVISNWPNYIVVGTNMTKTAITKNPCHVYTLYATSMPDYALGTREMKIYVKYTTYEDGSYTIGSWDNKVPLTTIIFTEPSETVRGDVNGDDVVDVDDLNIIINIMLRKAEFTEWPAADVDGNGTVDVDDMNAVINVMIKKD